MLAEIQLRLQARFTELSELRRALNYPVYAFEHGLETEEIDALKRAASEALRYQPPSASHWLVWTALGAEAGYRYSGDEYWPALEVAPGEWRSNDFRQTLREFYRRFSREYRGPTPVGRWAQHFSIIAWPINHAILPKYLQAHFARHLYDLRHDLPHAVRGNKGAIGQLLFRSYSGTSSRFRDFLQQTALTEQIVLALRDEESSGEVPRIDPKVLRRIVGDLEERRDARSYLRDARRLLQSTNVRIAPRLQPQAASDSSKEAATAATQQRFRLVACRLGTGQFALGLKLPDFSAAGLAASQLAGRRVRFAGENERFVPASNLTTLSGKERKLDRFPYPGLQFVIAEDSDQELARILAPLATLEERPCWVLRRQADGLYREVQGAHVRAKQDYLLICRAPPKAEIQAKASLISAKLDVGGAIAFRFKTPDRLNEDLRSALQALGIGSITGLVIEPAGLNPNPTQQLPTWLSTEPVILRISADFSLRSIAVSLDGDAPTSIDCRDAQTLLMLDQLEPGRHRITVSPTPANAGQRAIPAEQWEFEIAAPRPWPEAMGSKSGFRLILEPADASLEALTEGDAVLAVVGPLGRKAHWSVETYDVAGHLAATCVVGTTRVGEPDPNLRTMLGRLRETRSDVFDEAYQVDIVASLDELGRQAQRFPRTVDPLRWKFDPRTGVVRLIDETDHSAPVTIRSFALSTPVDKAHVDVETALVGLRPPGPGVLLAARYKDLSPSIFVSAPVETKLKDFAALGVPQSISLVENRGASLIRLIDGLRRWSKAKPVGQLASLRRETTITRLRHELTAICCGADFADLLASGVPGVLERAQAKVGGSQGFGFRMRTGEWVGRLADDLKSFAYFARHYSVEQDEQTISYALTLAYRPLALRLDQVDDKPALLLALLSKRTLLRGAFLARAAAVVGARAPVTEIA